MCLSRKELSKCQNVTVSLKKGKEKESVVLEYGEDKEAKQRAIPL